MVVMVTRLTPTEGFNLISIELDPAIQYTAKPSLQDESAPPLNRRLSSSGIISGRLRLAVLPRVSCQTKQTKESATTKASAAAAAAVTRELLQAAAAE